jgi:hypothetical protein
MPITPASGIPLILHQTWRSNDIPEEWRAFQQSWRTHNPAWEVMFWTDAGARNFIATEYPWFLETYDAYPAPVMRADALRYFLLGHYGGVYADMDYECLRPWDDILQGRELILVREPGEHARIAEVRQSGLEWLLCNALMASAPGHAFWQYVVGRLKDARGNGTPLSATGPIFLTRAWESFGGGEPVHVLDAEMLCPMTQTESRMGKWREPAFRETVARRAWAVHHWANTWVPRTSPFRPLDPLPVHLMLNRRIVMSGELRRDVPGEAEARTHGPRISCLMITRERAERARCAVRCFREQTWQNRELLIVDDGCDSALEDEIGLLGDRDIRFIRLAPGKMPLGALRNLAAAQASGEYVAQWDDDDLSHPRRLELQMAAMQTLEAGASFLLRELIWWPRERRLAISRRRVWESTILCRRDLLPEYPHERRGEDTAVTARLMRERRLALVDAPQLYLYVRHGANTFDEEHFARHWSMADARFEGADYADLLRDPAAAFPFGNYPDASALSET